MQQIVEEAVFRVPHLVVIFTDAVHSVSNPDEVFKEPECNVLVHGIVFRQNECNLEHVLAIKCHPRCSIRLIEMASRRELRTAVKHTDVIETEKTSSEYVAPIWIFTIHPPVEVQHQTLER